MEIYILSYLTEEDVTEREFRELIDEQRMLDQLTQED